MGSNRRKKLDSTNALSMPGTKPTLTLAEATASLLTPETGQQVTMHLASGGEVRIGDYLLTPTGLIFPQETTIEDWQEVGNVLFLIEDSIQLAIGDWLVNAEMRWGKTYEEAADMFGRKPKTLRNYHWICSKVEMSLRRDNLRIGHYSLVAALPYNEQEYWLDRASQEGWSIASLRKEMERAVLGLPEPRESLYIFDRENIPKVNSQTEKLWAKAQAGDKKARQKFLSQMEQWRTWIDQAIASISED